VGELLSKALPLALGAAVSPTVLALGLLILSAPKRPVARGIAYTAGVLVVLGGLTVLGLLVMRHGTGLGTGRNPVTRAIDGTMGVLLLLLALHTVLKAVTVDRESPSGPAPAANPDRYTGLGPAFLLGMAMMVANFSTILLYLPAMREVSAARVDTADKALVVAVVFLITSLPATLPLALRLVAPGPSARWFAALHAWVTRHQRQLAVVIEVVFGAYLLLKAL
jgi:hypothetical protein